MRENIITDYTRDMLAEPRSNPLYHELIRRWPKSMTLIEKLTRAFRDLPELLDSEGRRAYDIAVKDAKNAMDQATLFGGRFRLPRVLTSSRNASGDNFVVFGGIDSKNNLSIIFKLMKKKEDFLREVNERKSLDSLFILETVAVSDDEKLRDRWASDCVSFGFGAQFPYGIILPHAQRHLPAAIREQNITFRTAISVLRDCAEALRHIHSKGKIHGSFRSEVVVQRADEGRWILTNLSSVTAMNEPTNGSPTSGCNPPEEFRARASHGPPTRKEHESSRAAPTHDIWAYGLAAFEVLTGRPLIRCDRRSGNVRRSFPSLFC